LRPPPTPHRDGSGLPWAIFALVGVGLAVLWLASSGAPLRSASGLTVPTNPGQLTTAQAPPGMASPGSSPAARGRAVGQSGPAANAAPPSPAARQPRQFWQLSFDSGMDAATLRAQGYTQQGLEVGSAGLFLSGPAANADGSREGWLRSPSLELEFPSNALALLWKGDFPEGTGFGAEVSFSPDGVAWGRWHDVRPDPDSLGQIAEFYPDGRPNPNYGYTPGGMVHWGLQLGRFWRFRVTLSSESVTSPTLESLRLFYQDSSLGLGALADAESL